MEEQQIVDLYWERSETAITETEKKYGRYCHYIAYQILHNDEDAKEIVNDTCFKAWNTIPPKRPGSLKSYVGTISRNLALNKYEAQHTKKRGSQVPYILDELSECLAEETNDTDIGESIALQKALNDFLASLPQKNRMIFVRRYYYTSTIADIAREYGLKQNAVAALLFRTRDKLKKHLEREGFEL